MKSLEALNDALKSLSMRIRLLFTRGDLILVNLKQAGKLQLLQVSGLEGDSSDEVEHIQSYGFSSKPKQGAEVFLFEVLGQRSQLAGIVCDPQEPVAYQDGESLVWTYEGNHIHLRKDGGVTIKATGGDLKIEGPVANISIAGKATINAQEIEATADKITLNGEVESLSGAVGLGDGNRRGVARIGDMVQIDTGSSKGQWPIISGSDNVKVGD